MSLGIWLHHSGALGASPDGIVISAPSTVDVHYQSKEAEQLLPDILEVKCPYTARDMTVMEATSCGNKNWFLCMHLPLYYNLAYKLTITFALN